MSNRSACSAPFHTPVEHQWNAVTSNNTNSGTHTPHQTRQKGVPQNTFPQVTAFRSTHPLKRALHLGTRALRGTPSRPLDINNLHRGHICGVGRVSAGGRSVVQSSQEEK